MYTLLLPALGNLLFLALHITGSGSFPRPLSAREEQECLQKIQQGDTAAKNKLIEHNLRLVAYIARRFENTGINIEDLVLEHSAGAQAGVARVMIDPAVSDRCVADLQERGWRLITHSTPR